MTATRRDLCPFRAVASNGRLAEAGQRILAVVSSRGASPGGTGGGPAVLEAMPAKGMIGEVNCDADAIQERGPGGRA